jgi:nucleoside-diphosphate-sugar epimerase
MIHLAWEGLPNYKSQEHIEKNVFAHYFFLKNMLAGGLKNLLVTGTCLEYGFQSGSLTEDLLPKPNNPYAVAKDSLRKFLESLQAQYSFQLKWVRLFYMYGDGQNGKSIIPLLEDAIASGEKEFKMSGGEQLRDYLPVSAVAENIVAIALQNSVDGIVNCCSGKPISVRKLVEDFIQSKGSSIRLRLGYYPYPDYEPMAFWGDANKLNQILSLNE